MHAIRLGENTELETKSDFEQWMQDEVEFRQQALIVGGVYQIPVVVHVIHNGEAVGTATNVSLAAIQSQIDVLNEDFRKMLGTNGYNTHPSGADTKIEFCLAKRRPDGSAFPGGEDGVNRIPRSTAGFTAPPFSTAYIDATIKPYTYNNNTPAVVGGYARGWDPSKYLNIWLCNISGGILGYAQFPESSIGGMGCGTQAASTDGVVFLYNSIGKSAITGFPGPYNEGRTATHEVGHWLGLRHIWGDGNCTVDDFCNDTPEAGAANYGCPAGTNSCTSAAPDFPDMIENYMDYTDDLCMNIFTNDQKMRMRIVLESSPRRLALINSDACVPPNNNDARVINILNPIGDNCVGSIVPQVTIRNCGANNLTSATINYKVDNGATTTFAWTGTLTPNSTANVTLPAFTTILGQHEFKSWNTLPNGVVDPAPALDTSSLDFMVSNGLEAPFLEDFENGNFTPDIRWTNVNTGSDCYEWNGASATSITGAFENNAAMFTGFGNGTTNTENLITPIFLLPCNATAANIQFDVAYRQRQAGANNRLYIEISENCGTTWNAVPIYDKSGTVLATQTGTTTTSYYPTAAGNWRTETVDLSSFVTGTSKNVKFRIRAVAVNNGQNIWVDNFRFNATTPGEIDVTLSSTDVLDGGFANMGSATAGANLVSTFTVTNSGTTSLTLTNPITVTGAGFSLTTGFGSTTLAAGASTTFQVTFNSAVGGAFTGNVSFANNDCDESPFNFQLQATATVNPPVADFSGTPTVICAGATVTYTNLSTGAVSYAWSFPGGTPPTSTAANPTVTYAAAGTYNVVLTATNAYGSDVETKTNYITVVSGAAVPLPISEGFVSTTFAPTGWSIVNTNSSVTWVRTTAAGFAPTATSSMMFDNFNVNDADDDEVRLTAANFSGLVSAQLTFDVAYARYSAANFDGLQVRVSTDCGGTFTTVYDKSNTVLATNGGANVTTAFTPTAAQWRTETVNLNAYINNPNVIVLFKNMSGYGNRLFVDNVNLTGVTGATPPVASFTGTPTTICPGGSVTYTNTTTGAPISYAWTFAGGSPGTSTATNPTVTYATPGTYTVTLVATNGAGSDTETLTNYVTVGPLPTINAGSDVAICNGASTTLNSSGGTTYTWSPATGLSGTTGATVTANPTATQTYTVSGTSAAGCVNTDQVVVTVNPLPTISAGIDKAICIGGSTTITATGGSTYTWSPATGLSATSGATVTANPASTQTYTVTGTSAAGCTNTDQMILTVNPLPTISAGTDNAICLGGSTTITATGGSTYAWSPATGLSATTGATVTANPAATQTYTVTGTSAAGCLNTDQMILTVNPLPTVSAGIDKSICAGGSTTITATGGSTYTWSPATGLSATTGTTVTANPASTQTYTVTGTSTLGCTNTDQMILTVNPAPTITNGGSINPSTCGTSTGSITVNGAGTGTVSWTGAATGNSGSVTLPFTMTNLIAGSYAITFNNGTCSSSVLNVSISDPSAPSAPVVTVSNQCGQSVLSTSGTNLLWSTGSTATSITVTTGGVYTVTQSSAGCTSSAGSGTAAPLVVPTISLGTQVSPTTCGGTNGSIQITGSGSGSGTVSWSGTATGSQAAVSLPYTITALGAGPYSITFNNGTCVSNTLNATLNSGGAPSAPLVTVSNQCGQSVLTTSGSNLLWSTGSSATSITVTTGGTYTVTQTVSGCTSTAGSGIATPLTGTIIALGTTVDPSTCGVSDGTIQITGSGTGTISWSGSASGSQAAVTLPYVITGLGSGTYTVSFNNGTCPSNSVNATLNGGTTPSAPIVTVDNQCGMSVLSATGSNLVWSTTETSASITVTTSGSFFVSQTVGGCTSPVATVTASPFSFPTVTQSPFADVCIDDAAFTLSGGSPAGGTYSGTGVIAGVFDPSIAGFGTFAISYQFTDGNNCSAIVQQSINVGCSSVDENGESQINLMPNPTNGIFTIELQGDVLQNIAIFDQTGRLVLEQQNLNGNSIQFNLSSFGTGVYSVKVETIQSSRILQVIVSQ
ncbi:MAG: PKD domain-containing protein [Bacteroidota bacterium]